MRYAYWVAIASAILLSSVVAKPYTEAELKAMFVRTVQPEYPREAQAFHHTGEGLFRLELDERGTVTSVVALTSTGYRALDMSSLEALRRWQAKPGSKREVDVPVRFVMGSSSDTGVGASSWRPSAPVMTGRSRSP
jgi:TonB family protein